MNEAKQLRERLLGDIQALQQDNASWKRQITENEIKIAELEEITKSFEHLTKEGEQ